MTTINLFSAVKPHFKSIEDSVTSIVQENKILLVALLALGILALAFASLSYRKRNEMPHLQPKNIPSKSTPEEQKNTSAPIEQLETAVNQNETAVQNLKQENETLKRRLADIDQKMNELVQSKSQQPTTIAPSVQNEDQIQAAQVKLRDNETQIANLNKQLQEMTGKKDEAEKNLNTYRHTGQASLVKLQREKKALEEKLTQAKQPVSQSQEDIELLKQVREWLDNKKLEYSKTFYDKLPAEAQKIYVAILRSNELKRIGETKNENLKTFKVSRGMREIQKLITHIKDLSSQLEQNGTLDEILNKTTSEDTSFSSSLGDSKTE